MKRRIIVGIVLALMTVTASVALGETVVTLSAAGDVVLGGDPKVKNALKQSSEDFFAELIGKFGLSYPFQNVASFFQGDDVSIVNLECAVTTSNKARNKPHVLRAKPAYLPLLTGAGIEVVNIANNHSKDFGPAGYSDMRKSLTRAGIRYCDFTANGTYTVKKDGQEVKIGFAGFQTPVSMSAMKSRIKALSKKCDVVVASFHWCGTKEWAARVFPSDRKYAQAAILSGADLVLGHHRHVPAGIEQYRGKYIVYDMGNFVVGIKHLRENGDGRPLTDSMIFQWRFAIDDKGKVADRGIRVIPCTTSTSDQIYPYTDAMGNAGAPVNNFRPGVLTGREGEEVLARIQAMSTVKISAHW